MYSCLEKFYFEFSKVARVQTYRSMVKRSSSKLRYTKITRSSVTARYGMARFARSLDANFDIYRVSKVRYNGVRNFRKNRWSASNRHRSKNVSMIWCHLACGHRRLWSCPLHRQDSRLFDSFPARSPRRFVIRVRFVMHARNVLLRKESNVQFLFATQYARGGRVKMPGTRSISPLPWKLRKFLIQLKRLRVRRTEFVSNSSAQSRLLERR